MTTTTAPAYVNDRFGNPHAIDLDYDERNGKTNIGFGGLEFTPDQAVQAAMELLFNAGQAYRLEGDDRAALKQTLLDYAVNRTALTELVQLGGTR